MPDAVLRASVRRMVEFSMRGGDLLPASAAAMQEGSRAHRARQQSAQAIAERTVQWQGACGGIQAEIQGRVDLLWMDRDPILVDELKLISDAGPLPEAAVPAHRMQAVCYGFMLCEELSLASIAVRVSYVTEAGAVRVLFEETLEKQAAEAQFLDMLRPLAAWHSLQQAHLLRRDNSLEALRFPYPDYRPGQREMAVQVYTAIARKKRPGTDGKSGSFPARLRDHRPGEMLSPIPHALPSGFLSPGQGLLRSGAARPERPVRASALDSGNDPGRM